MVYTSSKNNNREKTMLCIKKDPQSPRMDSPEKKKNLKKNKKVLPGLTYLEPGTVFGFAFFSSTPPPPHPLFRVQLHSTDPRLVETSKI